MRIGHVQTKDDHQFALPHCMVPVAAAPASPDVLLMMRASKKG